MNEVLGAVLGPDQHKSTLWLQKRVNAGFVLRSHAHATAGGVEAIQPSLARCRFREG